MTTKWSEMITKKSQMTTKLSQIQMVPDEIPWGYLRHYLGILNMIRHLNKTDSQMDPWTLVLGTSSTLLDLNPSIAVVFGLGALIDV